MCLTAHPAHRRPRLQCRRRQGPLGPRVSPTVTSANITVVEGPARPGDAALVYTDPAKILRELPWRPRFASLARSLATAWRWRQAMSDGYPLKI